MSASPLRDNSNSKQHKYVLFIGIFKFISVQRGREIDRPEKGFSKTGNITGMMTV